MVCLTVPMRFMISARWLQQLAQFIVRLPDDFLHVTDVISLDRLDRDVSILPVFHTTPRNVGRVDQSAA